MTIKTGNKRITATLDEKTQEQLDYLLKVSGRSISSLVSCIIDITYDTEQVGEIPRLRNRNYTKIIEKRHKND